MKIKIIDFGYSHPPKRAHENDAGADVFADEDYLLKPHETKKIPLDFGLELPDGYAAFIFPRSSLSSQGIVCELPPVDSGYRGVIHAIVTNHTDKTYKINNGDRIGQLIIVPVVIADFVTETGEARGTDSFGSTGK